MIINNISTQFCRDDTVIKDTLGQKSFQLTLENYTVSHKIRATLFWTTTLAFLEQFFTSIVQAETVYVLHCLTTS